MSPASDIAPMLKTLQLPATVTDFLSATITFCANLLPVGGSAGEVAAREQRVLLLS